MEIADLVATFRADTANFERGARSVDQAILRSQSAILRMDKAFSKIADTSSHAGSRLNVLHGVTGRLGSAFGTLQSKISGMITPLMHYAKWLGAAGVAAGAFGAIKNAANLDALTRGLTNITGSAELAQQQLVRLREIAKLPGLGFKEAIQGSIRLQAVGFSAEKAELILRRFGNAIALTGGGRDELQRVTVQLGQMSAKGKILAMDLRPIIEAGPAVATALKAAFGTVDSEALQALGLTTDQFMDKLLVHLKDLPDAANGAKNAMENFGDSLFTALATIGGPLMEPLTHALDALGPLMATVSERIAGFFNSIPQLASQFVGFLPQSFKDGFGMVLGIVQSVGAQIIGWFTENMPLIKQTVQTVLTAIGDFWKNWGGLIKTIVQTAMTVVLGVIKTVMQIINGDWQGAWKSIEQIVVTILGNLPKIIDGVTHLILRAALALGEAILKGVLTGVGHLAGRLIDALKTAFVAVWRLAGWLYNQAIALGKAIVDGIWNGMSNAIAGLIANTRSMVQSIVSTAKGELEIKSPSRVFFRIGQDIAKGLALGIREGTSEVESSITKLVESAIQRFSTRQRVVGVSTVDNAQQAIKAELESGLETLRELAGGESALERVNALINAVLANPATAHLMDNTTQALLRYNAGLKETLKLTRERAVGLPFGMRSDPEATRERSIGIPIEMRADPSATRERRVLPDLVAEARERAAQIADDLTSIIGSAFRGLLDNGWRGFLQSMWDSAKQIFSQIADELINQMLRGILGAGQQGKAGGIIGAIMGIIGGAVGGGLGGATTSPSGVAVPNWVFGFAGGGDVSAGQWAMVGERGPELVRFGSQGHVFSNQESKAMGGNTINHYTINVPVSRSSGYTQPKSRRQLAEDILGALG